MSRVRLSPRASAKFLLEHKRTCCLCGGEIQDDQKWERHHVIELAAGGEDVPSNWRPAHTKCHRDYTSSVSAPRVAKTRRQHQKNIGARKEATMPGSRNSQWKKRMDGSVERRA